MGLIEKTYQNAKVKQSEEHGSSPLEVPIPFSCKNFSYTFQLKLPKRRVRRRKEKYRAGGGDKLCEDAKNKRQK